MFTIALKQGEETGMSGIEPKQENRGTQMEFQNILGGGGKKPPFHPGTGVSSLLLGGGGGGVKNCAGKKVLRDVDT